jgi:hypothetical protein
MGIKLPGTQLGANPSGRRRPATVSFGSLASGIVPFVEAGSNMAQCRATTPVRGTTPARAMNTMAERQRGTTPSATGSHRPAIASAVNGVNASQARPRLVGGMPVSIPVSRHLRMTPLALERGSRPFC